MNLNNPFSASQAINWDRIERFLGYGRIAAPVVFVGMEEGLFVPRQFDSSIQTRTLTEDLLARSRFDQDVMDAERAHRELAGGPALFSWPPRRQPTWRVMADVMLVYEGAVFAGQQRSEARRRYRMERLGRDGDALMLELLPYPHPKTTTWLYESFGRFTSRSAYEAALLPKRIAMLRSALASWPRKFIICYGKGKKEWAHYEAWERYKQLFDGASWRRLAQFEVAEWQGAKVTLTDHFSTRQFNTDLQLDELERIALRGREIDCSRDDEM